MIIWNHGGFLSHGGPPIAGWLIHHGQSQCKMEDLFRYPHAKESFRWIWGISWDLMIEYNMFNVYFHDFMDIQLPLGKKLMDKMSYLKSKCIIIMYCIIM